MGFNAFELKHLKQDTPYELASPLHGVSHGELQITLVAEGFGN
jgi:hypothetical protein